MKFPQSLLCCLKANYNTSMHAQHHCTTPMIHTIAVGTGDKDLIRWQKQEHPIIAHPPDNMKLTGFRDPYIIQKGGPNQKWKMLLGSGIEGQGGTLLLYEATDLTSGLHHIISTPCSCTLCLTASRVQAVMTSQSITAKDC